MRFPILGPMRRYLPLPRSAVDLAPFQRGHFLPPLSSEDEEFSIGPNGNPIAFVARQTATISSSERTRSRAGVVLGGSSPWKGWRSMSPRLSAQLKSFRACAYTFRVRATRPGAFSSMRSSIATMSDLLIEGSDFPFSAGFIQFLKLHSTVGRVRELQCRPCCFKYRSAYFSKLRSMSFRCRWRSAA